MELRKTLDITNYNHNIHNSYYISIELNVVNFDVIMCFVIANTLWLLEALYWKPLFQIKHIALSIVDLCSRVHTRLSDEFFQDVKMLSTSFPSSANYQDFQTR